MIPKIIHYCWFGNSKKSKEINICIQSWKHYLPDYEIIEWNESNSDLSHPFVQEAYRHKAWAFVSDYIRLQKLHKFGGVYLDVDMLILKNISTMFLDKELLMAAENKKNIGTAFIACSKNNDFINDCIKAYDSIIFDNTERSSFANPKIVTSIFRKIHQNSDDFLEVFEKDKTVIYSSKYFYSFPGSKRTFLPECRKYSHKDAYGIHLWFGSWVGQDEFYNLRNRKFTAAFKIIIAKKQFFNIKYFVKVVSCVVYSMKYTFSENTFINV